MIRNKHVESRRLILPDFGPLSHSAPGRLSANLADPIPETNFSQSTLSSTSGRDNQGEQHQR